MATKTARILSYLPGTFKVSARRSPLKAVVDTFGTELLHAENSLAALMRAHWVDHADFGAEKIDDLARIGSLYGLAPFPDQDVEAFRAHLKQYVKTALDGTVTVQGLLRTAACNLGLSIADSYDDMDTWWTRDSDGLTIVSHCGDDVATALFGEEFIIANGTPATAARIVGQIGIDTPLDLTGQGLFTSRTLRIKIDDAPKVTVDLLGAAADPEAVTVDEIVDAINAAAGAPLAGLQDGRLALTSPTAGADSRLELEEHTEDAAPLVLGLAPATAKGQAEIAAGITGLADLSGSNDLSQARYLRVRIDNTLLREIDCAGANPAATTLDDIVNAINGDLGAAIASHDGTFLTLTSTLKGVDSSVVLLSAAAQDAANALFGAVPSAAVGHDKLAAQISGTPDLSRGVDLSENYNLRIRVNATAAVNVDCRGLEPQSSQLPEIVNIINDTLGKAVAGHNGRNLILSSTSKGVSSKLAVQPSPERDAAEILLGIRPRVASGGDPTAASIQGSVDLAAGINLLASHRLRLALDQHPALDIDVASHSADPKNASLDDIIQAINNAVGSSVASHDGNFLTLLSAMVGADSQVKVLPFTREQHRRFVTRAEIRNEAAEKIFGVTSTRVDGEEGSPAQVVGSRDLSRGVDLRVARYLALQINQDPPVTIDCAGPRPRATLLEEVITAVNSALGQTLASAEDGKLKLVAPVVGGGSRIEFHSPTVGDASQLLLGAAAGLRRGSDATGVTLIGVTDLSAGVDLSVNHTLKITIDGDGPKEINCAGINPAQTSVSQVATAINVGFSKNIATHDGKHLILFSQTTGGASNIEILPPAADDATDLLLGITIPRLYEGLDATSAVLTGNVDLGSSNVDLSEQRYLNLAVDGAPETVVDCVAAAADPAQVSLAEIVTAINDQLGIPVAVDAAGKLELSSPSTGLSSRIDLQLVNSTDARESLFGDIAAITEGTQATAAVLRGQVDISGGADLSERNQLALRVDGQAMITTLVKGGKQDQVMPEEIADAINQRVPGVAAVVEGSFVELTSPSRGANSSIELLPIRYLLLQEYLPSDTAERQTFDAHHGGVIRLSNPSTAAVDGEVEILANNGVFGAGLVNLALDWRIRLFAPVEPGETVRFSRHPRFGVQARIRDRQGHWRNVPFGSLEVGPQLLQMTVPHPQSWRLSSGHAGLPMLVLNNPLAPNLLQLSAQLTDGGIVTRVQVQPSDMDSLSIAEKTQLDDRNGNNRYRLVGKLISTVNGFQLIDKSDAVLARLVSGQLGASNSFSFDQYVDTVVAVSGQLTQTPGVLEDELRVDTVARLFNLRVISSEIGQADVEEFYPAVTIGEREVSELSLQQQLLFGASPSSLLRATTMAKADILSLAKGRTEWRYVECFNSRFNQTHFNSPHEHLGRFAGGFNLELGLSDISHFHYQPPATVSPVFAASDHHGKNQDQVNQGEHTSQVSFVFSPHRAGTLRVILPVDLPPRYGARFNQALFSLPADKPEIFAQVVTEPPGDERDMVKVVNESSNLLEAQRVGQVPLGFSAHTIPFTKAAPLINGTDADAARIYLREPEVGGFIELAAKAPGAWGNQLSVELCPDGPAIFILQVRFPGSRFENARRIVLGDPLTGVINESLKPGARGVLHAKAAGVEVEVTRENCVSTVVGDSDTDVHSEGKPDV